MKFKVTPKDFKYFVIYCVILLYFCSIAVTNFVSFSNDGNFYGFNPIGVGHALCLKGSVYW